MQSAGMSQPSQIKKPKADQSQAKCFYCKKQGHWKMNYPQYITFLEPNRPNKKKKQAVARQGIYMITPYNFFIYNSTT